MKTASLSVHKALFTIAAALMLSVLAMGSAVAKTELLVYTAIEADELAKFKREFEKDYPDVDIKWVRDSTGIVTAKLLAEKDNPQADIVWGLAATSLVLLANEGYFQPYAPKGMDKLDPQICRSPEQATAVGRSTDLDRGGLLQHCRRQEEKLAHAEFLEGFNESGLQGPCGYAESELLGYRFSGCFELDPDVGRGQGLEVHG